MNGQEVTTGTGWTGSPLRSVYDTEPLWVIKNGSGFILLPASGNDDEDRLATMWTRFGIASENNFDRSFGRSVLVQTNVSAVLTVILENSVCERIKRKRRTFALDVLTVLRLMRTGEVSALVENMH